ncbi:MAG: hypothetical protein K0R80_1249 [Clostridia bacterium]|jgi:uncharacterized membrane protein YraQ (UPF0718 family)|nr:hypothetical protein [Clostridia bacterium]
MLNLLKETLQYVISTLIHNAPILIIGIFAAAAMKVYVDPERLKNALLKKASISISGSVAFGTFTPFCACGTMAVIVSMLTTALPWGPIMAFLTSSPLMSPDEFILYTGIIGLKFAVALTIASIVIGITSGYITHFIDKNTGFLKEQARFSDNRRNTVCCSSQSLTVEVETSACCRSLSAAEICCLSEKKSDRFRLKELLQVFYEVGMKRVLLYFTIFAAVGFMINKFVPATLITRYLGTDNIFAVPLLALIGLPLYVNGVSSTPIINALMEGGASGGALLAFMITGPGTSAGVIAGLTTIMKRRAIALYVIYILLGGIILGYIYDLLLLFGI